MTQREAPVSESLTWTGPTAGRDKDAFGGITEMTQPTAGELDLFKTKNGSDTKNELRIVEAEFLHAQ